MIILNFLFCYKKWRRADKSINMKKVLVTGGTGYLGTWIVKYLLERGYEVQLPVRYSFENNKHKYLSKFAENSPGLLNFWYDVDLLKEGSYDLPMEGCEILFHVASPFFIQSKNPQKELIDPAVKGTRNVLDTVNRIESVKRVILTSSIASVYSDNIDMQELGVEMYNETYFNNSSSLAHQPYSFSKALAEKTAWETSKSQFRWDLLVINPSFILGPVLSKTSNSESIKFIKDLLKGKFYFGAPRFFIGYVDVRDAALAHILAAEKNSAEGRYIISNKSYSLLDLAKFLKDIYGNKFKLPTYEAPKWLVFLFGPIFGVTRKFVRRNIGYPIFLDNKKSIEKLGMEYTSIEKTLLEMVESIKT